MKNIEQILKEVGIEVTAEQLNSINTAVNENYRTVSDYNKQKKKMEDAIADKETIQGQLNDAQETLKSFDGVDVEKWQRDLEDYKTRAATAEKNAQKAIAERDQKDYLKAEFDKLGITSERTRKSLMEDIMGEDGLKWKDGAFMGLSDYLKKENEKDHFYKTEEEKELEGKQQQAASKVPKFTEPSQGQQKEKPDDKPVPIIF